MYRHVKMQHRFGWTEGVHIIMTANTLYGLRETMTRLGYTDPCNGELTPGVLNFRVSRLPGSYAF